MSTYRSTRTAHAPVKWRRGDTLPLVKRYKRTDFHSGSNLVTNFHHSHRSTSCKDAPQMIVNN
ncbi:hypothetical protein V1477_002408 [Vespula maculifrons]|uniref:Uncharacterized protein n=1 Tax=Vespula maculifrons TaxID=7453 RepID=A0ABD2CWE6_VESMC